MFIQGYYQTSGHMRPVLHNQFKTAALHIADTVEMLLHHSSYPYDIVHAQKALLHTNGFVTCRFKRKKGAYYISIRSRSGIETWTSHPVNMNQQEIQYDFTKSPSMAFGNNVIQVKKGVWAFHSGDINQDGCIDEFDYTAITTSYLDFIFGYKRTDINGDGNVDLLDVQLLEKVLDVNKDHYVNELDYDFLKKHPSRQIHIKRPMN